jgi:hypothetical protein
MRIIGERIGRQARWQLVAHIASLRSVPGIAPGIGRGSR